MNTPLQSELLQMVNRQQELIDGDLVDWLNNMSNIPTPLPLKNSSSLPLDDDSDIDFTITPLPLLPPPIPLLSFFDLLDNTDDTSDNIITTLKTSQTSVLLQTPPLSPISWTPS